MILTLAGRSLLAHPVRSAVLACGFGLGVAVMAILLGVGEVILLQARSPVLVGGGDLIVTGTAGRVDNARFVLSSVLGSPAFAGRVRTVAPAGRATLTLAAGGRTVTVRARGGIPSLERALGDPEVAGIEAWTDTAADAAWRSPDPADVLRAMDRFHPVPDVPDRADSWAEWLYFNGRAGDTQFYVTFLAGPRTGPGIRSAGVRLQLDRGGRTRSFAETVALDEAMLLASAPDITIGRNRVRLDGLRYRIRLDLPEAGSDGSGAASSGSGRPSTIRATGEIVLEAVPGRSLVPVTVRGAGGWLSGYTVPVMSGELSGALAVGDERISLDGGRGYHDHNWGFWEGVSWRWGQIHHEDLAFVYGRIHPPPDTADPDRMPGFLLALGPDGPLGYSTNVSIEETDHPATGEPRRIVVTAHSSSVDVTLDLAVEDVVVSRMEREELFGGGMDLLQLRGRYRVAGTAGGRSVDFTAGGAAETFRGR